MKKIIRLTESELKEIINDKLAQAYGGESRSYPSGEQWTMGEEKSNKQENDWNKIRKLWAKHTNRGVLSNIESDLFVWLEENINIILKDKNKEPRSVGSGGWRN